MSKKMKFVVTIEDENGEAIVIKKSSREVPFVEEIVEKGFRAAFHDLETAALELTKEARDAAVSEYVAEASKKKTESEGQPGGALVEKAYIIQCELGAVSTNGHKWVNGTLVEYDSTESFFEKTGSREAFKSDLFKGLTLEIAAMTSFRNCAYILNRMRRADNGIIAMTVRNSVEREGRSIQQCMEEKAATAIDGQGLSVDENSAVAWKETGEKVVKEDFGSSQTHIEADIVHAAAKRLNLEEGSYDPSDYELAGVNISSDEVGVKRQTQSRPREEGKTQAKRVENTVIHVEIANETDNPKMASSSSYILNSLSVCGAFRLLLGFLCMNGLLGRTLVFFADGARNLNTAIAAMFGFANIKIILDWYHLRKKMEETLSLICNNRFYRNEMLQKIMPELWRGNVDGAVALLKTIDMGMVKDKGKLDYLIGYLRRVRATIPNYMLRSALGLRNSSNRGEKANDLIVSTRQKHNGMSWSDLGSAALASVSAVLYNNELDNWVKRGTLSLKLVERTTPIRPRRNRKRTDTAYSNASAKAKNSKVAAA